MRARLRLGAVKVNSLPIRHGYVLVFVEDFVAVSAADFVVVFTDVSIGAFIDVFIIVSIIVFTVVPAAINFPEEIKAA